MSDINIESLSALAEHVGVKEYGPMTRNWSFQPDQLEKFSDMVRRFDPESVSVEKILTPYKYRNLPCTNATHSVCGTDKFNGAGVLEWCTSKADAEFLFDIMDDYAQFENLVIREEVDRDNSLESEPKPPGHHFRLGGHHWVQEVDFDGRRGETIVLQWAPGAQRWVHSGNLATGSYVNIAGWKYVAECPMPTQDRLYVHILDEKVFVSSIDPADDNVDYESLACESFVAHMPDPRKTPAETQAGIIRNVLSRGGAKVTLV